MFLPKGYMLRGIEVLDYIVLEEFELQTMDTYHYGTAPTAGRNDRIGFLLEATVNGNKTFIIYDECYYHYECTRNKFGDNLLYIDREHFIRIPSDTTDYEYEVFTSYEDAKSYLYSLEENDYYVLR